MRGAYGRTMRSAKCTLSAISEPPKPRLITRWCGKSPASVLHRRMLELPTKTMAFFGGGLSRSCCSKAAISVSHLAKSSTAKTGVASNRTKVSERRKEVRMGWIGGEGGRKFLGCKFDKRMGLH